MTIAERLRSTAAQLARAVAAHEKIKKTLADTPVPTTVSDEQLSELQTAFEAASADLALGEGTPAAVEDARRALTEAHAARQVASLSSNHEAALRAGLEHKLADAEAEIVRLSADARKAEGAYLVEEMAKADVKYLKAALELDQALHRMHACRMALMSREQQPAQGFIRVPQQITFWALGPTSFEYALGLKPMLPGNDPGTAWNRHLQPRWDHGQDQEAIDVELAEASQDRGLLARVRAAISSPTD